MMFARNKGGKSFIDLITGVSFFLCVLGTENQTITQFMLNNVLTSNARRQISTAWFKQFSVIATMTWESEKSILAKHIKRKLL